MLVLAGALALATASVLVSDRLASVGPAWQAALVTLATPLVKRAAAPESAAPRAPAEFSEVAVRPLLPEPIAAVEETAALLSPPSAPEIVSAPAQPWVDLALQQEIEDAIPAGVGTVAVAVRHVTSGASAGVNADRVMPPASTYKLGVLLAAARRMEQGRLSLDERLQLLPEDWADGAGVLQTRIGQYVTAGEALRLMIGISDNTAALAMLRRLGVDTVNADYAQLGLSRTRFSADMQPSATAWEMATLLTMITSGQAAGKPATEYVLGLLAEPQPQAWIANGTPPDTVVAHKFGQLPGVRNDAALVYTPSGPYALVVLSSNLANERAGEALIATIAGVVHDHFAAWLGSLPTASSASASPEWNPEAEPAS